VTPYFTYLEWQDGLVIPTDSFLQASEQIVWLLDQFGMAYKPLGSGLSENIQHISKQYKIKPASLDVMVQQDIELKVHVKESSVCYSTLCIKRIFNFLARFLEMINEGMKTEPAAQQAFKECLEPYQLISIQTVSLRWVPNRHSFFESLSDKRLDEKKRETLVLKECKEFLASFQPLVRSMDEFFESENLSKLKLSFLGFGSTAELPPLPGPVKE